MQNKAIISLIGFIYVGENNEELIQCTILHTSGPQLQPSIDQNFISGSFNSLFQAFSTPTHFYS